MTKRLSEKEELSIMQDLWYDTLVLAGFPKLAYVCRNDGLTWAAVFDKAVVQYEPDALDRRSFYVLRSLVEAGKYARFLKI